MGRKTRRLLVPEVIQTSSMDCGIASVKAVLDGFGIPASYGRLREACQTTVDGTSIDALEEVLTQLGLNAEQIMLPGDYVLETEAEALPSIAVVRLPNGFTHFVVLWRLHGSLVQMMDPAAGRRWASRASVMRQLYAHTVRLPVGEWRTWAESDGARQIVTARLRTLGFGREAARFVDAAASREGWWPLATLDATSRMLASLVSSRGLPAGRPARRVFQSLLERANAEPDRSFELVPPTYWSTFSGASDAEVRFRGSVLVRVVGHPETTPGPRSSRSAALTPELTAALDEPASRHRRVLLGVLRRDGLLVPALLIVAIGAAAAGTALEAVLFRAILDVDRHLGVSQRLPGFLALAAFPAALLTLELPVASGIFRIGRRLEVRLRIAFLEKIARLGDSYFRSRLISDMAERSHSTYKLRQLPMLASQMLRAIAEMLVTGAAIVWLDPSSLAAVAATTGAAMLVPIALQGTLIERDLRVRSLGGALSRFYLDALRGLTAARTHGAEQALVGEHESLLVHWVHAGRALLRSTVAVEALQSAMGFALAGWLMSRYVNRTDEAGALLLLVYWALAIPAAGQELALLARQYPGARNTMLRLAEPLGAPEEVFDVEASRGPTLPSQRQAVSVAFKNVSVTAGGQTILTGINTQIEAGAHVAILGSSGAGKSTLVGLLLGWHRPASGGIIVDDAPLDPLQVRRLRTEMVWIDPAVQLWNRSLLENLKYGCGAGAMPLDRVATEADLERVAQHLLDGFQTTLGDDGGLLSAGERQRVRLGRAIGRGPVRLAILDEPFRGLSREQRSLFLEQARQRWAGSTLLCITHDIAETLNFDRVIVVENGRVVEDAKPADLAMRPGSRYREMLDVELEIGRDVWNSRDWTRLRLDDGALISVTSGAIL